VVWGYIASNGWRSVWLGGFTRRGVKAVEADGGTQLKDLLGFKPRSLPGAARGFAWGCSGHEVNEVWYTKWQKH